MYGRVINHTNATYVTGTLLCVVIFADTCIHAGITSSFLQLSIGLDGSICYCVLVFGKLVLGCLMSLSPKSRSVRCEKSGQHCIDVG